MQGRKPAHILAWDKMPLQHMQGSGKSAHTGGLNMQIEQILKLGEMGYTKAEIEAMEKGDAPKTEEPKGEPQPPKQDEPKKEEPKNDTSSIDELKKFITEATETLKGLQAQNINNSQQPPKDDVNSILASIIAPPSNDK